MIYDIDKRGERILFQERVWVEIESSWKNGKKGRATAFSFLNDSVKVDDCGAY